MEVRLLSWNLWTKGNGNEMRAFLATSGADIIALQEVKDDDPEREIIRFLTGLGYHYVFTPIQKSYGRDGVAVFSKYPIISSATHLLSDVETRGAIQANIQVNGVLLHIFSTHLIHTHDNIEIQTAQAAKLLSLLPSERTVVAGDFNATPDAEAIQKMKAVLTDSDPRGQPTWKVHHTECPHCMHTAERIRFDYLFHTPDVRSHAFTVHEAAGSDHLPISAKITI